MLPAGDRASNCWKPPQPDSPIAKFLEKRGPGLHHVALRVPDLAAAVERLKASGARLLNEPRPAPAAISTSSCIPPPRAASYSN